MRGWEGGSEGVLIGAGGVVLIGVAFLVGGGGCRGGSDDPLDGVEHDCEVAWVMANDGDDETVNDTSILELSWCIDHMAAEQAEEAQP